MEKTKMNLERQGMQFEESIELKKRNEETEQEQTIEMMKKKGWRELHEINYEIPILNGEETEIFELDHIEYADDTELINTTRQEEVLKLRCYKKTAEEYDLEIQWKKTQILRRAIKPEDEGKTAGLPEPFHEVKQEREAKILGLNISINKTQEKMVKGFLEL